MLNFETPLPTVITKDEIVNLIKFANTKLQLNPTFQLKFYFVSKDDIQKLNFETRELNEPTDVLSFEDPDNEYHEIYLCSEVIKANSSEFGVSFKEELLRTILHGYLHILGYDHEKSLNNEEEMFKVQEKVLTQYLSYEH